MIWPNVTQSCQHLAVMGFSHMSCKAVNIWPLCPNVQLELLAGRSIVVFLWRSCGRLWSCLKLLWHFAQIGFWLRPCDPCNWAGIAQVTAGKACWRMMHSCIQPPIQKSLMLWPWKAFCAVRSQGLFSTCAISSSPGLSMRPTSVMVLAGTCHWLVWLASCVTHHNNDSNSNNNNNNNNDDDNNNDNTDDDNHNNHSYALTMISCLEHWVYSHYEIPSHCLLAPLMSCHDGNYHWLLPCLAATLQARLNVSLLIRISSFHNLKVLCNLLLLLM